MGTFCAERAKALSRYAEVRVMVPIPYFPRGLPGPSTWRRWARVERHGETAEGTPISYPRYLSVPKVATWSQGLAMARSVQREFDRAYSGWRPDIVDGHFAFPDGYAAVQLARRLECASLVTCHGSDLRLYPPLPFAGRMLRNALRQAGRVIAVSPALRQRSIELGCPERNAVFLANGVDTERFTIRDQADCRRRMGLPTDAAIALCAGHLDDNKNQLVLIEALASMQAGGQSPPHLVLVGDGPLRGRLAEEALRLRVDGLVHVAGPRPYDEMPHWMAAADWLVLASHWEGWPTVYFEAMACGRPVITSNVGAARDAVCRDEYGLVVEPNTPEAFARAMAAAMNRQFDAAAIRAYAEEHSWDCWAVRFLGILGELIEDRGQQAGPWSEA